MTPEAFTALVLSCGISLPPGITPERLYDIATVESGLRVDAISPPNRNGSRDRGLLQLNDQHIGKPGFPATKEEALKPCPNIRGAVIVLEQADRRASCYYNSGGRACENGYPEKIQAAAQRRVRLTRASVRMVPAPPAAPETAPAPPTLSYGQTSAGAVVTYGRGARR